MTKKQLQEYIEEIRPKADAYERVCSTLGIDKDILGYIEKIKANRAEKLVNQPSESLFRQWIHDLPKKDGQYITCDGSDFVSEITFEKGRWVDYTKDETIFPTDIIKYMPLPKP
jgi:hypothetical protein